MFGSEILHDLLFAESILSVAQERLADRSSPKDVVRQCLPGMLVDTISLYLSCKTYRRYRTSLEFIGSFIKQICGSV